MENEARINKLADPQLKRINTSREPQKGSLSNYVCYWLLLQCASGSKSILGRTSIATPLRQYFLLFWVFGSSLILASIFVGIVAISSVLSDQWILLYDSHFIFNFLVEVK